MVQSFCAGHRDIALRRIRRQLEPEAHDDVISMKMGRPALRSAAVSDWTSTRLPAMPPVAREASRGHEIRRLQEERGSFP